MTEKQIGSEILDLLKDPFDPKVIHWRVGATNGAKDSGIALAYLNARDVMKRLDEVMGVSGWQDNYNMNGAFPICNLGLKIEGEWIWKSDGAGETQVEGQKGAASDAFKRAAVKFGVGRYLYYLPNEWVPIKAAGRSYKLATTPNLPDWAKPSVHRFKAGEKDKIVSQVKECLQNGDEHGINEIFNEYGNDPEEQMKVWALFTSSERSAIKALTN